jgi:hypothetical protein
MREISKAWFWMVMILSIVGVTTGCSLLQLPVKTVEGTFGIARELLKIAGKLPMPPPGVF